MSIKSTPEGPDEDRPVQLTLQLPRSAEYVPSLRRTVTGFLSQLQAPAPVVEDLELVVGELATNAVRHAEGSAGYRVEVVVCAQRITVIVTDQGRRDGLSAAALPAPGTLRPCHCHIEGSGPGQEEALRFGGWGLPLVHSLCDRVEIQANQPRGTRVRAEKHLRRG